MESAESYQVITNNLVKILKSLKISKFSLLDIYAENNYLLGDFISSVKDKLKDIVVVGDIEIDFDGEKRTISTEDWETNGDLIAERLKNSVVIYNKLKLNKDDFAKAMENFSAFFPVIYIITDEGMEEQPDWKMQKLENDVLLYINRNIKKFKSFTITDLEKIKSIELASLSSTNYKYDREEEVVEISLEQSETAPVTRKKANQLNFDIFKNLPSPSITPDPKSKVFMQEFYSYLYTLLGRILPPGKEKLLPYILNKKTIKEVWLRAFTHKVARPEIGENYETLETTGDKVQEYALFIYILERFPNATNQDLTNIKQQVLKTEVQGPMGEYSKMSRWAIMPDQLRSNQKEKEDLFESFFGALDKILNDVSSGLGQVINITYYVFKNIFDDYNFAKELEGPDRNYVDQMIKQIKETRPQSEKVFQMKKPNEISADIWDEILICGNQILKKNGIDTPLSIHSNVVNDGIDLITTKDEDSKINIKVVLNKYGSDVFAKHGKKIKPDTILGEATEATLRPAKDKAYKKAKEFFIKKGITPEWRDKTKRKKTAAGLEKLDLALAKARSENPNIVEITVEQVRVLKRDQLYQVLGIDKNNKKYVLDIFVSDDKVRNNYQLAIDNYLDKN